MISHIESIAGFKPSQFDVDAIDLLKAIKRVQHEYKTDKHLVYDLHMVRRVFLSHIAGIEV